MEYKAKLDEALKRKRMYNDNLFMAYALIWERYAKSMQNKILARSDYEYEIYNNPIKHLKAIKEHALDYQETCYKMSIISMHFKHCGTQHKRKRKISKIIHDIQRHPKTFWYVNLVCDDESKKRATPKRRPNSYLHFYTWKMQANMGLY